MPKERNEITKPLSCEIALPMRAPVSQIGIGSGPGIASRARAPVTKPEIRIARTTLRLMLGRAYASRSYRRSRRRRERDEVAADALDLVAQLGGVLEAQLLGGLEHLLLERDDELLELLAVHALDLVAAAAARARDVRRFERKELGDVGDALRDRDRRRAVLLVVGELDGAAAVRLVERALDRLGHLVGVHQNLAVDVPRGAADRLDERGLAAQEAFLVGVEDRDER